MDTDFEEWARARTPALLRAAYLLCGDQHLAEDLVQTTLVQVCGAWRRIDRYPDAYAERVLYRAQVKRWRRRRVHETLTGDVPDQPAADRSADVDARLLLQPALASLTASQRAMVVLRFYGDLSEPQIAELLGCSVGTVKSQTHKALRALRRQLPALELTIEVTVNPDA